MPEASLTLSRPCSHKLPVSLAALACIAVQFPGSLLLSAVALATWIGLLLLCDRRALARLWLPRFWLLTLFFALGSGLLLGPHVSSGVSAEGLRAGLLMVLRGAFIFSLASWASRALGGDQLQRVFGRIGLARLGSALNVAMCVLPELQDKLQSTKPTGSDVGRSRLRRLRGSMVELVMQAARLGDDLAAGRSRRIIAAVIGAPRTGKTTVLRDLAAKLAERGLSVAGILQPAIVVGQQTVAYQLRAIPSNEERPFAHRRTPARPGKIGFEFDDHGWTWARAHIRAARRSQAVVIVDELGKLEAAGQGHLPALQESLAGESDGLTLVGVRTDCADAVAARLGAFRLTLTADADPAAVDAFAEQLCSLAVRGKQEVQK